MSRIALRSNPLGTGTFTIESPNSNTDSTITLPDGGGAIVLTDATQTLTNKTISGANNTVNNLAASSVSSGTFDVARIPDLAASKITSGTLATARLGSGTADSTTFLRGDNSWQTISTTPTTAQVLTATAGASVGAVGSYAMLTRPNSTNSGLTASAGSTLAGSSLNYAGATTNINNSGALSGTPAGTWRCMGFMGNSGFGTESGTEFRYNPTMWLRIS